MRCHCCNKFPVRCYYDKRTKRMYAYDCWNVIRNSIGDMTNKDYLIEQLLEEYGLEEDLEDEDVYTENP